MMPGTLTRIEILVSSGGSVDSRNRIHTGRSPDRETSENDNSNIVHFDTVSQGKSTGLGFVNPIGKNLRANGRFNIGEDVRWSSFAKTFDVVG